MIKKILPWVVFAGFFVLIILGVAFRDGVGTIPTQILLDKHGKEFFRHSGYYSASELEKEFLSNN